MPACWPIYRLSYLEHGEWDVLVVLDACRTALWNEVAPEYTLPANEAVWTNASCSFDWILWNPNEHPEEALKTGYVTGNPFADHDASEGASADLTDDDLAHFAPLYKTEWTEIDETEAETIPPQHSPTTQSRHGGDAASLEWTEWRPLYPASPTFPVETGMGAGRENLKDLMKDRETDGDCAWQLARKGEIDTDELWDAYQDNLCWVLDDVTERLLPNIDGTAVFTADHGKGTGSGRTHRMLSGQRSGKSPELKCQVGITRRSRRRIYSRPTRMSVSMSSYPHKGTAKLRLFSRLCPSDVISETIIVYQSKRCLYSFAL